MSHKINLIDGSTVSVTTSVARALPYLSKASQTGYLWIDQITINQLNTTERNDQVKIMGDIYSRSLRCLVWIDHDPYLDEEYDIEIDWDHDAGQDVLNFFRSFNDADPEVEWQTIAGEKLRRVSSTMSSRSPAARRKSYVRDHLQWFFEHPWFTRTWVYQEFVLAPQTTFLIGHFQLPGNDIERVFKFGWMPLTSWFDSFHDRLNMSKRRAILLHKAPGPDFFHCRIPKQAVALFTGRIWSGLPSHFKPSLAWLRSLRGIVVRRHVGKNGKPPGTRRP
jgi:hypothetical protein